MQRAIEGVIKNGKIVVNEADLASAENAKVLVLISDTDKKEFPRVYSPRLAHPEQAREFRKLVLEP